MATDTYREGQPCPVCQGVAAGGRIRMTDEGADLLEELLVDERRRAVGNRRLAKDAGEPAEIHNHRIRLAEQLLGEVHRTQDEMGWSDGQLQRSHA